MRMCHFWAQNNFFALNKFLLVKAIDITFIYLLALFIAENFKKILREDSDLWACTIFESKMVHLPQTRIFLEKKLLILFSSTYWPLSLCKIFKKIFQLIQNYEDVLSVLGPKWPICPNKIFFGKPINKSSKTLFLGHLCPMGIFSKKFSCHTQLYMGP